MKKLLLFCVTLVLIVSYNYAQEGICSKYYKGDAVSKKWQLIEFKVESESLVTYS